MGEPDAKPTSWRLVTVGDVVESIQAGFASGEHQSTGHGLPHLRPMNVTTSGRIDRSTLKLVDPGLATSPHRRLKRGDVLFNNTNSLELVGKTAVFNEEDSPAFSNHMTRLRVRQDVVLPEYLARYLHGCWIRGDFLQLANNHVSQASVGRKVLGQLPLPLPSLSDQRRVVDRLEEAEAHSSAALAHLSRSRSHLEDFRRAVLAAACTGRLTEDWREGHPDARAVPPRHLVPARARRGRRLPDVTSIEISDLPDAYQLTTIGDIATVLEYGTSRKADGDAGGVPIMRMGNIQDGKLDLADLKYITIDREVNRLLLEDGDLLFNRTNSPELVGKSAVWRGSSSATFASYLIRVRFHQEVALPEYVNYWIGSAWGRQWAYQVKTDGVSQSNINGTKLAAMPIPLPPIDEQREIVRRAEEALSGEERALAQVDGTIRLLKRATRAAHVSAFRGELSA